MIILKIGTKLEKKVDTSPVIPEKQHTETVRVVAVLNKIALLSDGRQVPQKSHDGYYSFSYKKDMKLVTYKIIR